MDDVKGCIHPVNPSDSLHHPGRIPGDIVINHHIGTVQVYTFGEDFSRYKYAIIIFLMTGASVKVLKNFIADRLPRSPGKQKDLAGILFINVFKEVISSLFRFRENNKVVLFQNLVFWIAH